MTALEIKAMVYETLLRNMKILLEDKSSPATTLNLADKHYTVTETVILDAMFMSVAANIAQSLGTEIV